MDATKKEVRRVHREVDPVLKQIEEIIPAHWTPQMTAAVFNLFMQMYE